MGGIILVAGFSDNLGLKEIESFFRSPIDWKKIKSKCGKIVAIFSDNDQWVPLKHAEVFKEKLGAKIIVMHGWKHFSGDDGISEVPKVLEEVLKMAEK